MLAYRRVLGPLAVGALLQFAAAADSLDPASGLKPGSSPTLLNDWIRFYASFDHGATGAELASGSAEPTSVQGNPRFDVGILGTALRVGGDGAELRFACQGNLELAKPGALSIWVAPREWSDTSSAYVRFVRVTGQANAVFVLERDVRASGNTRETLIAGAAGFPGGQQSLLILPIGARWRAADWHLLVIDWDATGFALSLDGTPFVRHAVPGQSMERAFPAGQSGAVFVVGDTGAESSLVDDLTVYERPLADEEVAQLFAAARSAGPRKGGR
jgi:hypothetical protein